jgi:hypothetical protein
VSYRYWLIETPLADPDQAQDEELPTLRLAERALAERVADLVADDFVVVRLGIDHATLTHPDEGKVELFIEEGRAVPLVTVTVPQDCTFEDFCALLADENR